MLVKDNNKIGQYGAFLPMYYRTNDCFRQGAPGCPDDNTQRTATNRPFFLYHSLPAPTATVPISTALMPAISQWLNGWAKTNQFVGCTAKPAADASVSAKAHSCNTPSCPKRTWCALSNASAMAVLLKQRQTSVRWIPAPYSGCWKEQVNVPQISIVCSLKTLMSLSKRYRWMNYTAKQSKLNAGPLQLKFPESDANAVVKKGQDVASYGSGREKQVSSGIYHWSTHPSNGNAIDRLGGDLCQLKPPAELQVGVVKKIRDSRGNLLKVSTKILFGRKKKIEERIQELGIGRKINTSHTERLNGTIRGQQARLARRTRNGSHLEIMLQYSVWLWRDLYNWTRVHYSLLDETPAMALGLSDETAGLGRAA